MKQRSGIGGLEETQDVADVLDVPASPVLKVLKRKRYGSIPDLPDEELATVDELERVIFEREWGPVMSLPVWKGNGWIKPNIDENGHVDYGAFASIDFDRHKPKFDTARYKAGKLKEELRHLINHIETINDSIPGKHKYKLLRYVRHGIIDKDDIPDWDIWQLAVHYMRALKLRKEIAGLEELSRRRRERKYQKWLDSLG